MFLLGSFLCNVYQPQDTKKHGKFKPLQLPYFTHALREKIMFVLRFFGCYFFFQKVLYQIEIVYFLPLTSRYESSISSFCSIHCPLIIPAFASLFSVFTRRELKLACGSVITFQRKKQYGKRYDFDTISELVSAQQTFKHHFGIFFFFLLFFN